MGLTEFFSNDYAAMMMTDTNQPETGKSKKLDDAELDAATAQETGETIEEGNDAVSAETQAKIDALEAEVADLKDKYLRAAAEMENIRRRAEKERADLLKYGLETFFRDLLPVLDSFDKALPESAAAADEPPVLTAFKEGIAMVKRQLDDTLKRHGLETVKAKGEPFDFNVHQAIQRIESAEHDTETVAEEYARGYLLNGRLMRPSMVSVFVPKKDKEGDTPPKDA